MQVPALWMSVMSTRVQEVYSLSVWYADVLRRYEQLAAWTTGSLATPNSVWLSGLFNPKAFLTAVRHAACSYCAALSLTAVHLTSVCIVHRATPALTGSACLCAGADTTIAQVED
jgi:hypothetical protein